MGLDVKQGQEGGRGATAHLQRALACSEPDAKNFHIRQALQLLVARDES